ncbi:hypothetical protein FSARC_2816 [Fusarium sarcochroum]|uniref:Glycine-rich domain-containing protein 1 n=1 Tax=Fusarium sarcochroum TaxID=1208366 RepID=A0A8H4XD74_9HYPO|nr:hypothetical protein FSARC_2816 [Fusarium sarcochroum]
MAQEHRLTKLSLHEQGKEMVLGKDRPKDPNGLHYRLAFKPEDWPIIPDPSIFQFENTNNTNNTKPSKKPKTPELALPTVSECAAHLEFLETLYMLRQKILVSIGLDEVFQTNPVRETKTGVQGDTKTLKDEGLWERRQAKWPKYVEFAVVRFLAWREELNQSNNPEITNDNLPPLDVLMVWHSFLLNPKLFHDNCSEEAIFSIKFPWKHIHEVINNAEWDFRLKPAAAANWEETTLVSSDLFKKMVLWGSPSSDKHCKIERIGLNNSFAQCKISEASYREYSKLFERFDSKLAEQLRDAVIRQASFVDKMNSYMWIRSPALEGTIQRGIKRYLNFCKMLKMLKSTVVPTLDIDLVWHTHQCTARHYGPAMKVLAGKFVNHDDTIEKPMLGDSFGETRRFYRVYFGQEYRACGCWDCQALLSELEKTVERGDEDVDVDMDKIAAKVKDDVFYHRAVEWARRHKMSLPVRRN